MDLGKIHGFDWDISNQDKNFKKHGIVHSAIEEFFRLGPFVLPDAKHSGAEERFIAFGEDAKGKSLFVVFTIRDKGGQKLIRPISARFMHGKERERYAKKNSEI